MIVVYGTNPCQYNWTVYNNNMNPVKNISKKSYI